MKKFVTTVCVLGVAAITSACATGDAISTDNTAVPYSQERTAGYGPKDGIVTSKHQKSSRTFSRAQSK